MFVTKIFYAANLEELQRQMDEIHIHIGWQPDWVFEPNPNRVEMPGSWIIIARGDSWEWPDPAPADDVED